MNIFKKLFKGQDGQAMVELALILPILLMLCLGIFEFGRILGSFMIINNLARDGARFGVVGHDDLEITNRVISGHAWLDENNMTVTISPSFANRNAGDALEVNVDYSVPLMTSFFASIINENTVPLSAQCSMRVE